ncbi:DNA-binding protein [Streptomyces alboflavus]|uniref:DNA-binding protein n=1 Tax=Streptomyces alboflavus TaxID=67267 RepID=A0A1Z1W4G7_9ACTN|nr:DNA-binding protein [Streptomyces alboflavus]
MTEVLSAPLVVEFPFTRSLGPVQSAFLTGLRERTVLGVRTADGKVLVPPVEYDPATAAELRDLVEVAPTGTVTTWAWNHEPRRGQPLDTPSPGSSYASTAPTRPCCTPSTSRARTRCAPACASASAGPPNAPAPSRTSPASSRTKVK